MQRWHVAGLSLLALVAAGCAPVRSSGDPARPTRYTSGRVAIGRGTLDLHFASTPFSACVDPLVVYASGDGGWFGAAVDMFREIAESGCPAVGFSSRAYLRLDRASKTLANPTQLAGEYERVIATARQNLGLPDTTSVVLTGWSRGAAFAVVGARELARVDRVAGVVAVGLADGEDLALDDEADDEGGEAGERASWPYRPYRLVTRLQSMRAAVIQATGDDYLPAAAARTLFGPDTPDHRLFSVEARNHRFSGGTAAFNRTLREALQWVLAARRIGRPG